MSDCCVTVALRVRPLVKSEVDRGCRISVQRAAEGVPQVTVNRSDSFTYNYVFDSNDTQQYFYETCVRSKLQKLLDGFNITILAYGQTGSGKTFTMGTAFNGVMDDNVGVIPRAVHEIFEMMATMKKEYEFKISCSFVELYQEQFYDLFSPNKREESTVDLREDRNRIVIPGLTEVEVADAKDVTDQLIRGSSGRAVASTAMNETSSRSHAIFTLTVTATKINGQKSVATSKFNLVDLAGSERCSKTLTCGDRFKEGVNINKGLLALGNVINVLGSGQNVGYVPYRQSKLTRLLQDSLGGNSITLMIACVSPADYNVAETLSTLRYADRALQIKNKPVVNLDPHAAEIMVLNDIIHNLRLAQLANGGAGTGGPGGNGCSGGDDCPNRQAKEDLKRLSEQMQVVEQKNRRLQKELQQALIDLADNEMRAHIAEVTHDKLKMHVLELRAKLTEQPTADGPTEQEWHTQQLRDLTQMVAGVDEELQQTDLALQTHRKECLEGTNGTGSEESNLAGEEAHEGMQSRAEEYTLKQLDLNGELRNINRQLDLKQELHDRVTLNFSRLHDNVYDEKLKESQLVIEQLEAERRELLDQVRNNKQKDTSAKLAEERRKRLQLCEQEITDMRRKIVQQNNMLKMREKEREKIQNLSTEIRTMKESKVKLIRTMRSESEKFRQWKLASERQLTQLKSKDRKMQSEMVRQQTLHANQRQVLKRKCEEAVATNKRLKDALDRQKNAQMQRQKHAKDPSGAEKLDALLDRELEVILSLVDAEHSLDQLLEDRAVINSHFTELKEHLEQHPDTEREPLLVSLEEELEMRNAQITDLQQKVCTNDLDTRMSTLRENAQSIGEARAINGKLLKSLVQQRRELAQSVMERKVLLDEHQTQLLELQRHYDEAIKCLRDAQDQHEEKMAQEKRSYEEKVAVLLRTGSGSGSGSASCEQQPEEKMRQQIVEELLVTKESLQKELDDLKSKSKAKKHPLKFNADESVLNTSMSEDGGDADNDPDWVPQTKRSKKSNSNNATINGDTSNTTINNHNPNPNHNNNNTTFNPTPNPNSNPNSSNNSLQTSKDLNQPEDETMRKTSCNCRIKCNTKRCGCYSNGSGCSSDCKCRASCQNPSNKENSTPGSPTAPQNATITLATHSPNDDNNTMTGSSSNNNNSNSLTADTSGDQSAPLKSTSVSNSSRLPRNSQLLLDTPSSKKKFF